MRSRLVRLSFTAAVAGLAAFAVASPALAVSTPGNNHSVGKFTGTKAKTSFGLRSRNMTYHGGPIEQAPAVYISWWGPQWGTGWKDATTGYTSGQAQTYVTDFFNNVGGSTWANTDNQYCQASTTGFTTCPTGATHVTNPAGQLKGTWNDTTAVPTSPSQTDINNAATRAEQYFVANFHANPATSTFFVFTPTGHSQSGFAGVGGNWCAYHGNVGSFYYAYMPYQPDAGGSCGENFINANNSYGNGFFDGFSVVGGHEYAEAVTDPYTQSGHYAWYDSGGNEIGDKCAWNSASGDISLPNGHVYAVQPLWSNAKSGCVLAS
jgi:serine protease